MEEKVKKKKTSIQHGSVGHGSIGHGRWPSPRSHTKTKAISKRSGIAVACKYDPT